MAVRLLPHGHRCRSPGGAMCLSSHLLQTGITIISRRSPGSADAFSEERFPNTARTSTSAFVHFFALLMCALLFLFLLSSLLSPFPPLPIPPLFPHFSILSRLFYLCLFLLSMFISFLSLLPLLSSSSTCSLLSPRFP